MDLSLIDQYLRFTKQEDVFDSMLADYDEEQTYTLDQLSMYGFAFTQRFRLMGKLEDITRAVQVLERAVRASEPSSDQWQKNLNDLGNALSSYYGRSHKLEHLNRAIRLFGQLAEHIASDADGDQPDHLINLCTCLLRRFQRIHKMEDLDRIIRLGQEIIDSTSKKAFYRAVHLENHITALMMRFTLTGQMEDQKNAIHTIILLVTELDGNSSRRVQWLEKLSKLMLSYYNQTKDTSLLREMIDIGEQLVAGTPADADYLPALINLTASGYMMRFIHGGEKEDLVYAIQHLEHAITLCLTNPFYLRQCYLNLGTAHNMRYTASKDLADLDLAIEKFEQAVALVTPDFHSRRAYIGTLIDVLQTRFERTENLSDLDRIKQLRAQL